nr:hypothetical protein [Paenibacillus xylanexedens]
MKERKGKIVGREQSIKYNGKADGGKEKQIKAMETNGGQRKEGGATGKW